MNFKTSQFQKVKISVVPGISQSSACFSYWTKCNLKPTFLPSSALQQEGNKGRYIHNKLVFSRESTIAKSNHTYQMPQITQLAQLKSTTVQNYSVQFGRRPTSPGLTPKLQTVMCSSPPMSLIPGLIQMMLLQNSTITAF